ALDPYGDGCVAHLNLTAAAMRTALLVDYGKSDSVAEVENLLKLHPKLVVRAHKVSEKLTNRRHALEAGTHPHRLVNGVGCVQAPRRDNVAPIRRLNPPAHQRDQVGGRGLLCHRPPIIPPARPSALSRHIGA